MQSSNLCVVIFFYLFIAATRSSKINSLYAMTVSLSAGPLILSNMYNEIAKGYKNNTFL